MRRGAPAAAQLTPCAISGEFVAAATMTTSQGTSQVGGYFTFTPPSTCAPGASGTVAIDVIVTVAGGPTQPIHSTQPYQLNADLVTIGNGLVLAGVSGISGNVVTSMAFNGGSGLVLAGSLLRRNLDVLTGAPGPTGPAGPTGALGATGPAGAIGAGLAAFASFSTTPEVPTT